ncbi:hypothetical protein [[Phormidium] sp. ETS-05]|uniref:hypothetical protein n=1 Tax=[Phormidium] sp. ETS-05 TaxID=222819 RepID=UPI0018EECE30|nr:hypothetical protein [[Phormidium] sp. ETS-05]
MTQYKQYRVFTHRLTSPDGKVIAEAKSAAIATGNGETRIHQTIKIDILGNRCSSSSTSESVSG